MDQYDAPPDSFLGQICLALGMRPARLAMELDIPFADIKEVMEIKTKDLVISEHVEIWRKLMEHVDVKTGMYVAVREELNRRMQHDRTRRVARIEKQRKYRQYIGEAE